MFLILLTILIGGLILYHLYKYETNWKYINKFPGPRTLPFIGNAHNFGLNSVDNHKNLFKMWETYGHKKFRAWIGYLPFIVVSEFEDVETILSSNKILKKAFVYNFLHSWLGEGLLTSVGQKWFKHRKMITPSFHFTILKDFFEVMKINSNKFVEKLDEKAKTGEIFDVQDMIHYCTLDVICETAMGTEINAMDKHDSDLVKAFQDMCYVIQRRFFDPTKVNPFMYSFSNTYQIEKKALDTLKTFTMNVIEHRRIYLENNGKIETNVTANSSTTGSANSQSNGKIETHGAANGSANSQTNTTHTNGTVNSNSNGNANGSANGKLKNEEEIEYVSKIKHVFLDTLLTAKIDDKPLTIQEIYEEVSTFMFEGHDTTTSGITFTINSLARHPAVQIKVYEEQVSIFGAKNLHDVNPTFKDIQDMKYLDLVIKETLRLYPSVPVVARETTEPMYLDGKYVPVNTNLTVFVLAMGYNEKYFPDPLKFMPERFVNRDDHNPFEYVPFSAGPRNCIGQKFAMLELKSIVSSIVRNFEILPATDEILDNNGYEHFGNNKYDPILAASLTLKSDNGVHIRLKQRVPVH